MMYTQIFLQVNEVYTKDTIGGKKALAPRLLK